MYFYGQSQSLIFFASLQGSQKIFSFLSTFPASKRLDLLQEKKVQCVIDKHEKLSKKPFYFDKKMMFYDSGVAFAIE